MDVKIEIKEESYFPDFYSHNSDIITKTNIEEGMVVSSSSSQNQRELFSEDVERVKSENVTSGSDCDIGTKTEIEEEVVVTNYLCSLNQKELLSKNCIMGCNESSKNSETETKTEVKEEKRWFDRSSTETLCVHKNIKDDTANLVSVESEDAAPIVQIQIQHTTSDTDPDKNPPKKSSMKRKSGDNDFMNINISTMQVIEKSCEHKTLETRDENDVFGELVAAEMRKIKDPFVHARTKLNIHKLLFEAQFSNPTSSTPVHSPPPSGAQMHQETQVLETVLPYTPFDSSQDCIQQKKYTTHAYMYK